MRFLVTSIPMSDVPVEELPGLLTGERAWYDRNREYIESYGWFVGRGGYGVVDVPDLETLSRMIGEHPFSHSSKVDVQGVVDADVAVQQVRTLLEQQGVPA